MKIKAWRRCQGMLCYVLLGMAILTGCADKKAAHSDGGNIAVNEELAADVTVAESSIELEGNTIADGGTGLEGNTITDDGTDLEGNVITDDGTDLEGNVITDDGTDLEGNVITDDATGLGETIAIEEVAGSAEQEMEPEMVEADWSAYFHGLNGAAVLYDASQNRYVVYNDDLAMTRRSPCSTFKIISSLIALEKGIIVQEDSVRTWSGETFWNEDWNKDLGFQEAFRCSCVWYFREVIDEIGKETMQEELDKLGYGNCDITDWEGRLNSNNNNRALTGFWIESSLAISPREQVDVMKRIFGSDSSYSAQALQELEQAMFQEEESKEGLSLYGKTGMGKAQGIVVDAWFTGFAKHGESKLYYCVYLGRTDGMQVSSAVAREIATEIVSEYLVNLP